MNEDHSQTLLDLIRSRRSIRRYEERSVPHPLLENLLEAACWAPSAHNRQPWRFAVVEANETKRVLASAMGARLIEDLQRDGAPRQLIEADVSRSYDRITDAPVLVIACVTMQDMDEYSDRRRRKAEWTMAGQSVAMAVQNLLLAAHAVGLGACWMCAPLFVPDTVRDVLKLDSGWEPQALITIGYPAETKSRTREPLSSVVRYLDTE